MFDRAEYKRRRAYGHRGQTNVISKRGLMQIDNEGRIKEAEVGGKPVSAKALRKNTKRARKARMENL